MNTKRKSKGPIKPPTNRVTIVEFEGITFQVFQRHVKYARVEFKPSGLRVIVPRIIDPLAVLKENRQSILKKYQKMLNQLEAAQQIPQVDRDAEEFQTFATQYIDYYSKKLDVEISKIKFRKMKRRWGSCRSDGVITLNSLLQFIPDHLVVYIIHHELTHLIIRGHNKRFRNFIAEEFPNYRQLDKELNLYGLKLLC